MFDRNNPALGVHLGYRGEPPLEPPDGDCPLCDAGTGCRYHDEPAPACDWCGEVLGPDAVKLADGDTMHQCCVFECEEGSGLLLSEEDEL